MAAYHWLRFPKVFTKDMYWNLFLTRTHAHTHPKLKKIPNREAHWGDYQ